MASADIEQRASLARAAADASGNGHVFAHWGELDAAEKAQLLQDVEGLDYAYLSRIFVASTQAPPPDSSAPVEPVKDVIQRKGITQAQRDEWTQLGYRLIAEGRAAVLLLAGGQGTRLGSSAPKGCYNIGLPSGKSLFQLQAERLKRVQQLAAEATSTPPAAAKALHWYIMTSPFTHAETVAHFEAHDFFGLAREQVHFFQQGFLPAFTEDGKLILESRSSLAKAPDGNGGVYLALSRSGALADMAGRGVTCVDAYCVDNAAARLGDPLFLGACAAAGAEVGARVVAKAYPEEKVGVFALRRGEQAAGAAPAEPGLAVIEYSELDPALAAAPDPATGQLYYNWANICMHYFALPWLLRVASELGAGRGAAYHVARKQIPSVGGAKVPGVKLELFIFDTFPMAGGRTALVEVERSEAFTPVKNAPGSATDSPDTARAALLALHQRWVVAAGGAVAEGVAGPEVSPLVSYAGEGLAARVGGRTFGASLAPELQAP